MTGGWGGGSRDGTERSQKLFPLNHVTIFWSFAPKSKTRVPRACPVASVLRPWRRGVTNTCDTLYQLIWSKCRRHFAPNRHRSLADLTSALREAHLCASAQPRAMRSAALRAAFCISIGGHRSKTDRGSQKEKVGRLTYLLFLCLPNNFEPLPKIIYQIQLKSEQLKQIIYMVAKRFKTIILRGFLSAKQSFPLQIPWYRASFLHQKEFFHFRNIPSS